jgi:hypothetical protein
LRPDWFPQWRGETVVLVASGPSAKDVPLELAKGKARFIAVNNSWTLCPWADVLYGCDRAWWLNAQGAMDFKGLKMSIDRHVCVDRPEWGVKKVQCNKSSDRLHLKHWGVIGWAGNSGFGAFNIAIHAIQGIGKIILVGFDMTTKHGSHWHGDHPDGMHNPSEGNIQRWRRCFDDAAKQLKPFDVQVINCSPISALQAYPKMTFAEALEA